VEDINRRSKSSDMELKLIEHFEGGGEKLALSMRD
jgi:hypothetical protein